MKKERTRKRQRVQTLPFVLGGVLVISAGALAYVFRNELGFGKSAPPPPPPPAAAPVTDPATGDEEEEEPLFDPSAVQWVVADVDVGGVTNSAGVFYVPAKVQTGLIKFEEEEKKKADTPEQRGF